MPPSYSPANGDLNRAQVPSGRQWQQPIQLSIFTSLTSSTTSSSFLLKDETRSSAVQILDILRNGDGSIETETKEMTMDRPKLPGVTEGTAVRWIHLKQEPQDLHSVMGLVLKHQELGRPNSIAVCKLLEQFRKDQERDSNHGRYFEPAYLRHQGLQPASVLGQYQDPGLPLQFLSIPYLTYGHTPPTVGEVRRCLHPTRTLFQHHYRRETFSTLSKRDGEQICRKVRGQESASLMLVNYLWVLAIGNSTIITSTPNSSTGLWQKLRLLPPEAISPLAPSAAAATAAGEDSRSVFYSDAPPRTSLTELSGDVNNKVSNLVSLQWRINSELPPSLSNLLDRYSDLLIRLPELVQRSVVLRIFFRPRVIVMLFGVMNRLFTNQKWKDELSSQLEKFTAFYTECIPRWKQLETVTPFAASEELHLQLVRLYSKILKYADYFLRAGGPPLVRNNSFKTRIEKLFDEIQELALVLEWNAEAVQMKANVFSETEPLAGDQTTTATITTTVENMKPASVDELINLIIDSYIPEDSLKTSRAFVSEIYAQHLSTLQFESQQAPTKALIKDLNQIAEELDIVSSIIKAQQKVLRQFQNDNPRDGAEKMNITLQKLDFFHSDIEEYRRSCNRTTSVTKQQVELQMEHHGKAIVVFTIVTLLFLPLSFVSSFFGMNVVGIRDMQYSQWIFWATALVTTFVVVGLSLVVAFLGEDIVRRMGFGPWWATRWREQE